MGELAGCGGEGESVGDEEQNRAVIPAARCLGGGRGAEGASGARKRRPEVTVSPLG